MEKEALIQVKNLSFSYDDAEVLKNISVDLFSGERIAVMGSNGAGKSTFFLNLNGVLHADKGELYFHGKQMKGKKELRQLRRNVGFVFQDADAQLIASNVFSEISFGPMNMGLNEEEVSRRVEQAMEELALTSYKDRAPHYLSGGEKKKVSIADILAMDPEVLIFDEPMAALDPMHSDMVEEILLKLSQEKGKTLLIATHDVNFAYRFADRVLVFSNGELIGDGTPKEIFNQPQLLQQAHLKQPDLLVVWNALVKIGAVREGDETPLTPQQLEQFLFSNKQESSAKRKGNE